MDIFENTYFIEIDLRGLDDVVDLLCRIKSFCFCLQSTRTN
jgi:hypothetical protein